MKTNILTSILTTICSLIALLVLLFWNCCSLHAQSGTHFALTKEESHLFFTTTLCGQPAQIMLESGIPALLIGEDFYEQHLKNSNLSFEQSEASIRLLNNLYRILFQGEGSIAVGQAIYDGPIFILENFNGFSMPVQHLKDAQTERSVVVIDLPKGQFSVGEAHASENRKWQQYPLSFNSMGMPTIQAELTMRTVQGSARLKGDFIVDFGNPMLLFLMRQHPSLDHAIKKGRIALQNGYDNDGRLVSKGIYAVRVSLCGRKYHDLSIGITDKMQAIEQLGFLGLPFFEMPVVLDFDNKVMWVASEEETEN